MRRQSFKGFNLPPAVDLCSIFPDCADFSLGRSVADPYVSSFDENFYFATYPEVADLVATGRFASAEDHWIQSGRYEGRACRKRVSTNPDFVHYNTFLDLVPEVQFILFVSFSLFNEVYWTEFCHLLNRQSYRLFRLVPVHDLDHDGLGRLTALLERYAIPHTSPVLANEFVSQIALLDPSNCFVTFLDAANGLALDALYWVAKLLFGEPDIDAVYGDEAIISDTGTLSGIYFKPGWSPEFFLSQGFSCGLTFFRLSNLQQRMERDPISVEDTIEFSLILSLIRDHGCQIRHLERPLLVRRLLPERSEAWVVAQANLDNAVNLVREFRSQRGFGTGDNAPTIRLGAPILRNKHSAPISIIIPTADATPNIGGQTLSLLNNCLEGIRRTTQNLEVEIIAVHNKNMTAPRRRDLHSSGVKLLEYDRSGFNYARKVNLGTDEARHETVLILNDDVYPTSKGWLERMLASQAQDRVGAVGAKLLYPDGRVQHGGVVILNGCPSHIGYGRTPNMHCYSDLDVSYREVIAVTGACLLTSRAVIHKVGGWNENFASLFDDVDFCLRLGRLGLRVLYDPRSILYHLESVTLDPARSDDKRQQQQFIKIWGRNPDLYYNRALSSQMPYRWAHEADVGRRWQHAYTGPNLCELNTDKE